MTRTKLSDCLTRASSSSGTKMLKNPCSTACRPLICASISVGGSRGNRAFRMLLRRNAAERRHVIKTARSVTECVSGVGQVRRETPLPALHLPSSFNFPDRSSGIAFINAATEGGRSDRLLLPERISSSERMTRAYKA